MIPSYTTAVQRFMLFFACLAYQQQSLRDGSFLGNHNCCHTETEVADQTCHLTQSQYTDTRLTSPTYAHCSQWSIGHLRPLAMALCSGLLWSFRTSWSPAVSALLQCLASSCCEAGLSFSSPAGSRSGLGVWCWMLASWGCVRSSPTSSALSAWPLVPVPLTPTDLHFGSSLLLS